jgi:diguanylate cyclase (GGDEF)-like protein
MDTTTLVLANILLFALCAGVILVNARIVGGMRGALWFAGANLCRGVSTLLIGVEWLHLEPTRFVDAGSGLLAMIGALMLHQAFAELLEQRPVLREVQFVLLGLIASVLVYFMAFPTASRLPTIMVFLALGFQYLLIAVLVYRVSDEEVGPVGWLMSLVLGCYALIWFLRSAGALTPSWAGGAYPSAPRTAPVGLMVCLLTTAATAFGFMSMSTAKLRVELLWRAQVDDLTGLLNRWALKRMALKEIQRSRRGSECLAVVMMDLDGLKLVNDTKGHSCGDVVLQSVAGVLQETLRTNDSVARMGGDEFCVLLPGTSMEEALMVAERLREEISGLEIRYRGETIETRASLGVASSDISGLEWQSLIDDSDAALYRAKRDGKDRVVSAMPEMVERTRERYKSEGMAPG